MGNGSCVPARKRSKQRETLALGCGCPTNAPLYKPCPGVCHHLECPPEVCSVAARADVAANKLQRRTHVWDYPAEQRARGEHRGTKNYRRSDHGIAGRRVGHNFEKELPFLNEIPEYSDFKNRRQENRYRRHLPEVVRDADDQDRRDRDIKGRYHWTRRDDLVRKPRYTRNFQSGRARQRNEIELENSNDLQSEKRRYNVTPLVPRRLSQADARVRTELDLPDNVAFRPSRVAARPALGVLHESPPSPPHRRRPDYEREEGLAPSTVLAGGGVLYSRVKQVNHIYPPSIELGMTADVINASSSGTGPRTSESTQGSERDFNGGILRRGEDRQVRGAYQRDEGAKYQREEEAKYQREEREAMYQREGGDKYQREKRAMYHRDKGVMYQREEATVYQKDKGAMYEREERAKIQREERTMQQREERADIQREERGRYQRLTIREPIEELEELRLARRANEEVHLARRANEEVHLARRANEEQERLRALEHPPDILY